MTFIHTVAGKLTTLTIVLFLALVALGVAFAAFAGHRQDSHEIAGTCRYFYNVAAAPIESSTNVATLKIVASARSAYEQADCHIDGGLPAPDPRLIPALDLIGAH